MKPFLVSLLVVLSACKQYAPKAAVYSSTKNDATLAASECKNQNVVYLTQESSAVTWTLDQLKGKAEANETSSITSKNPASGKIILGKGLLNQLKGVANFNVLATSTGDPIRDRLFQEVLFETSHAAPFRFTIEKMIGETTAVANGASVDMKAAGTLELGGRKSAIIMPVKISEKDGIYNLVGSVQLNARESRPSLNAIDLDDKLKLIETTLTVSIGKSLSFDLSLQFKNDCVPKR